MNILNISYNKNMPTEALAHSLSPSLPPRGYLKSSINQLRTIRQESPSKRWKDISGLEPEESHFTLILPIHNESRFLPNFLSATFLLAILPSSVHASVLFVTNACTDNSPKIIENYLKSLGDVHLQKHSYNFIDLQLDVFASSVRVKNMTFTHLDIQTAGKANALNIGNRFALASGHEVAMSIDANNFVEPEMIAKMFGESYAAFIKNPNGRIFLSGKGRTITDEVQEKIPPKRQFAIEHTEGKVNGWFMSWNPKELNNIGGFRQTAFEDYCTGVDIRRRSKKIGQVNAYIWGNVSNKVMDTIELRSRCIRGSKQLLRLIPETKDILQQENHYMRNFPRRLQYLYKRAIEEPQEIKRHIGNFASWELALFKARIDLFRNPNNQSWKPIKATK